MFNEIFNSAHRIIEEAARSNMQSVFTDCPHREKLGWLEEVHLNGPGLLYNYDLKVGKQIMQNMADAQRENGSMPTTVLRNMLFSKGKWLEDFAESPEWERFVSRIPIYV